MTDAHVLATLFDELPQIRLVEHHAVIGSTNDRAHELAQLGTPEIALVQADEQLAGRGRQNRSWYTPPGTALAFSLLLRPAIAARQAMRLTMLAGLAVVEGIEQATGLRLDLKWPNDIVAMTNDQLPITNDQFPISNPQLPITEHHPPAIKKVGGILTESAFAGDAIEYAVVGIGLNVNIDFSQQAELREIATSLRQLAGREIDRRAVLKAVGAAWIDRYAGMADAARPGGADRLREDWAARLINLRRPIRVDLNDQIVEGFAEGVADDGALLLRTADSRVQHVLSGDVILHDLNRHA